MSNTTFLYRRNRIYYYRRRVPKFARCIVQKREVVFSLQTEDFDTASDFGSYYTLIYDRLFQLLKLQLSMKDIRTLIVQSGTNKVDITPEEMERLGLSMDDLHEIVSKKMAVQHQPSPSQHPTANVETITLTELVDKHKQYRIAQKEDNWSIPSGDNTRYRRLLEILGDNETIGNITHDTVETKVLPILKKIPSCSTGFKGMTVKQIVTENTGDSFISGRQINNHLSLYRTMFSWAQNKGLITLNPFDDINVRYKKIKDDKRQPFTSEELKKIFSTPVFTEHTKKDLPNRFWGPLLGLFTGARLCEISGLDISDIKQEEDFYYIDFNKNNPKKCDKTYNAIRTTPIHPSLIHLGFIKFVEQQKSNGHQRIFSELKYNSKDHYGRQLSEGFKDYTLKPLKIYKKSQKVFHSFRHTFRTYAKTSGIITQDIDRMIGHEISGSEGDKTYSSLTPLSYYYDEIKKIDFYDEIKNVKSYLSNNETMELYKQKK